MKTKFTDVWKKGASVEEIAAQENEADGHLAAVEPLGEYIALKDQMGGLEVRADELKQEIVELLGLRYRTAGTSHAFPGLGTVSIVAGRKTSKISRSKLVAAGVDPKVIDACTVVGEGAAYVRILRDGALEPVPEE